VGEHRVDAKVQGARAKETSPSGQIHGFGDRVAVGPLVTARGMAWPACDEAVFRRSAYWTTIGHESVSSN